ncbi:MAG: hypothetical protein PVF08_09070 [Gammaproteobacteria bacterium]
MSGKYATPLTLEVGQSRRLGSWLLLTHGGSLALLPLLQFSAWLKLPVILVLVCGLLHGWRLHVTRRHPQAIRTLCWKTGRRCRLELASGREVESALKPQAVVLPWLVILGFSRHGHGSRYLVLLPDMLDRDRFRQLRVRLKIELGQ